MAFLIVTLIIVLVLAFVVARPSGSYDVPGRGYSDYRLLGFSGWLRNHVTNSDNWNSIRDCIFDSKVCLKLNQKYASAEQFYGAHLSPIQVKLDNLYGFCLNVFDPVKLKFMNLCM